MSCLYAPYVSPVEKKLRERLKAARARIEGQAYRRDACVALPVPVIEISKPVPVLALEPEPAKPEYKPWFRIVGMTVPAMQDISYAVCAYYNVSKGDLMSDRRMQPIAFRRQIAMYLTKELTGRTLPAIGRYYHRDHTVILYAVRKISAQIKSDPVLAQEIKELKSRIGAM